MKIRLLQWNVGGFRRRLEEADAAQTVSYKTDDIDYFAHLLANYRPHIVTMQETHSSEAGHLVSLVAEAAGMDFICDSYDASHLDQRFQLSQAILSLGPLHQHEFSRLSNPGYEVDHPQRGHIRSMDKGLSRAVTRIGPFEIDVYTTHGIPFELFGVDQSSPAVAEYAQEISYKFHTGSNRTIFSGDLNLNMPSTIDLFPKLKRAGFQEAVYSGDSTPKGAHVDHVMYKGVVPTGVYFDRTVLSDHYLMIVDFEVN